MMNNNGRKTLTTVLIIAAVIITALIAMIFFKGYRSAQEKYESIIKELEEEIQLLSDPVAVYEEAAKEVDVHLINAEIQDIRELATIEYLYTNAGKFENSAKLLGKDIPFSITTSSFIAKWDGVIKAGVDVSKIRVEKSEATKEIIVYIPKAEILSHEIDDDSIQTLDQQNGLFNRLKVEDIREFDAISKDAMEQKAMEYGILDKAFKNAKEIIYKLIYKDVEKESGYTIAFQVIEES
ncbi:MAG: DUF4230 domain-containing protein [Lachnospiraceae bacterium]|nr:DUF4230 domain-containing protein [Lachnospiraceae bacterium]